MNGRDILVITLFVFVFLLGIILGLAICARETTNRNMFCPECGRHYRDVGYCEYDGTELKEIQK